MSPMAGLKVGLLGGSFNPAHAGHRHISLIALRRLGLDQVGWLVSPGNPLKPISAPMPNSPLVGDLLEAGCEVRGDAATAGVDPRVVAASPADWDSEYLDKIIAVRVVDEDRRPPFIAFGDILNG